MDDQDLSNVSNRASVVEERHPSVVIVDDCHIKREGKFVTAQGTASGDSLIGPLYEIFDGTRMVKLTKELYELYKEWVLHQNCKHASEDAKISNTYFPRWVWKIESRDDSEEWVKSYMEGEEIIFSIPNSEKLTCRASF